ncbi:MAG: porin family protein [Afipia sp.]|nr:porin family protein [Afipia sp.]
MRKVSLLVVAAASFAFAGAASAADMAAKPVYTKAPVAPVWSWTGSYIGGYVGGAWADPCTSVPVNGGGVPLFGGGPACYNMGSSVIGGYTGGYNWQFAPNWLVGYEGETGYMKLKGTGFYPGAPTVFSTTETGSLYSVWAARFGYVMDKSLIYVKGGAALAQFENTVFNGAGTVFLNAKKYEWTYAVGGGWEYAFDPKWSLKAEYLYLGFDSNTLNQTGISNGLRVGVVQEFAGTTLPGIHTVKVGLNYKWDWFSLLR